MSVHRIRLRGPWRYEWLTESDHVPRTGRVSLPRDWREIFGEAGGRVRFQRTFHAPTNLEPNTQVNLVCEGIGGKAKIVLNERDLGQTTEKSELPLRLGIGEFLLPTNDLRIEIHFAPQDSTKPGGLWDTVALEIVE